MLQAVATCVNRKSEREAWCQESIAAWEKFQPTDLHLTNDEVSDWLGQTAAGETLEMPERHCSCYLDSKARSCLGRLFPLIQRGLRRTPKAMALILDKVWKFSGFPK